MVTRQERYERFLRKHGELNRLRFRGEETPPQIAAEAYLNALERELAEITEHLNASWGLAELERLPKVLAPHGPREAAVTPRDQEINP